MAANAPVAGGDEVNAVVIDLGSYLCRAGYAGDDTPKAVLPSAVGVGPGSDANGAAGGEGGRGIHIGFEALSYKRDNMEIKNPIGEDDLIEDWDLATKLWTYALKERLRVDPSEMAVMLAEPTHNPRAAREKAVSTLFESTGCPALFLAKAAVLSAFAVGRQTALVVDAGHSGTTVAAVYEGYVLNKTVTRSALGGGAVTRAVASVLEREAAAKGGKLLPRHAVKRVPLAGGKYEARIESSPGLTASYNAWGVEQVATDAKEALCEAGEAPFDEGDAGLPPQTYELPDGTQLSIGADRFRAAELLFDASQVSAFPGLASDPAVAGRQLLAWPTMVKDAIDGCDGDVRREFWASVVLTGGTSLLTGVRERLECDLTALAPGGTKVKAFSPVNPSEKRFASWIGGSILASLGSFHQLWMSKAEYEEHGAALIHRKSP